MLSLPPLLPTPKLGTRYRHEAAEEAQQKMATGVPGTLITGPTFTLTQIPEVVVHLENSFLSLCNTEKYALTWERIFHSN